MKIIEDKPIDLTFEEFCQGGKSITPWPWEASQAIRHGYTVYSKDGFIVGCEDEEGRYGAVRYAADARLIAAAPDLLQVVVDALEIFEFGDDDKTVVAPNWVVRARAAIAKAKGKI